MMMIMMMNNRIKNKHSKGKIVPLRQEDEESEEAEDNDNKKKRRKEGKEGI